MKKKTITSFNGAKYVGELKNGKYHGRGTCLFANGEKYVGRFKNDRINGQGVKTYPDGEKYAVSYTHLTLPTTPYV